MAELLNLRRQLAAANLSLWDSADSVGVPWHDYP